MTTWEKEKACKARRAAALATEMESAIEALDKSRFLEAYQKSFSYMKKAVRSHYYRTFLLMSSVNR